MAVFLRLRKRHSAGERLGLCRLMAAMDSIGRVVPSSPGVKSFFGYATDTAQESGLGSAD